MTTYNEMSKLLDEVHDRMDVEEVSYTDEQKYQNYLMLIKALRDTEGDYELGDEWMKEHADYIMKIHKEFDFENIETAHTPEEKRMGKNCQTILNQLVETISEIGTFDVKSYRDFCILLEYFVRKEIPEEDLEELFANFGIN